jgi:hypothetical protein
MKAPVRDRRSDRALLFAEKFPGQKIEIDLAQRRRAL